MNPTVSQPSWFSEGWTGRHLAATAVISLIWSWMAPVIFSLYLMSEEGGEVFFLAIMISMIVSVVVGFLFCLIVYPICQRMVGSFLAEARSGGEVFLMLLVPQQVFFWVPPLLIYFFEQPQVSERNLEILMFWILVSLHAIIHLYRYSIRMYKEYHQMLELRILGDEASDPSTGISGSSGVWAGGMDTRFR